MKEKSKELEFNSLVKVVESTKDGRTYYNLVVISKLNNGDIATYQVKLAFYNKKFAYKLANQLPR